MENEQERKRPYWDTDTDTVYWVPKSNVWEP